MAVYAETFCSFEIVIKQNLKAEFIGFYGITGCKEKLMTSYKFNTLENCLAYCQGKVKAWMKAAIQWSDSQN